MAERLSGAFLTPRNARARLPYSIDFPHQEVHATGHQRGREVDGPAGVKTTKPNREGHTMTSTLLSRRDMLKGTVALAAASVGINTTTRLRRASAQERAALQRERSDSVLRQAVEAKDVPGIVAMAATDKGLLYAGAFGTRVLDSGPPMTLDTVFRIASMTKAIT